MTEQSFTDRIKNPYQAPTAELDDGEAEYHDHPFYSTQGRIGRVKFVSYTVLLSVIFMLVMAVLGVVAVLGAGVSASGEGDLSLAGSILMVLLVLIYMAGSFYIQFVPAIRRLNDLNQSGWLSLLYLVPLVNVGLYLYLLFAKGNEYRNDYGEPAYPPTAVDKVLAFVLPLGLVFLLGIVAAIALPAYQDYVQRADSSKMVSIQ